LPKTAFIINNEQDKKSLKEFIKNETNITINCYSKMEELPNNNHIIITLIYKDGKYTFKAMQNTSYYDEPIYDTYDSYPHYYLNYPIMNIYSSTQEDFIDLFEIGSFYRNNSYYNYYSDDFFRKFYLYERFVDFQSLLAKYLIFKEKKIFLNKNMIMSY